MFATDVGHRLAKAGHVVFMDNSIYNGQPWAQRLMDELRRADVVVCVITSGYVRSPWGLAEAAIARYRGRLLPVLAEPDVRHPLLQSEMQLTLCQTPHDALEALPPQLRRMSRARTRRRLAAISAVLAGGRV